MRKFLKSLTTSKQLLWLVMLTYFVGVIFGAVAVWFKANDQLYAYLSYIGAATTVAIGFYTNKAKAENLHKNPDIVEYSCSDLDGGKGEEEDK